MKILRHAAPMLAFSLITFVASAQAPADPAPPAQDPPPWSVGAIDFSGFVDGYYNLNFNHPASQFNRIRNFDVKANQLSLNMAMLKMAHEADPVGFQLDLGFGRAMELFHGAEPGGLEIYQNIFQAYMTLRPQQLGGLQIDFGKFVTSAGAEPTETYLNWNYSRSLIYANGPYYHFGLRTAMPLNENVTVGFQLVNGWNNVEDNNTGKTVGLTAAFTSDKISWFNNYYVGPEQDQTNFGRRHFYDTVVTLTPNARTDFYLNFDYGREKLLGPQTVSWITAGGAARFQLTDRVAFSPRAEWYHDRDGFITGVEQRLKEVTLTGEYRLAEGFLTRVEYRRDWSDQPFFDRGNQIFNHRNQDTFLVGFVAFFGPRR